MRDGRPAFQPFRGASRVKPAACARVEQAMSSDTRPTSEALRGWLAPGADLYRAVVEQGPEAVIFADREGVIRLWNARAEQMFGYAPVEVIGKSLDLIIPQHLRAAHWQGYHRAIAAGRTRLDGKPMLTRATHKDGSKLYVELAFGIVSDARHGVLGALATARKSSKPQPSG